MAEAAQLWANNGGQNARRALNGGIAELARMIAFDLAQGGPPNATDPTATYDEPPGAKVLTTVGKYGTGSANGFVVREENGGDARAVGLGLVGPHGAPCNWRSWLRLRSGELSSVGELYR